MKQKLLILLGIAICACNNSLKNNERYTFSDLGHQLEGEKAQIISDLKKQYATPDESREEEADPSDIIDNFANDMNDHELREFDYYRFDNERFNQNPTTDNLQASLVPREEVYLVGTRDGQAKYRIIAEYSDLVNSWTVKMASSDLGKIIAWLPDSLSSAKTKDFKIFSPGLSREFVTYKKDGEALYFKITGERWSAEELRDYFVEEYKQGQAMQQYIKEHPELFELGE